MSNNVCLPKFPATEDVWKKISKTSKAILVYGMGNGADKLIAQLSKINKKPDDFFASDGFVRGHSFHGKRVLSFSEAKEKYDDFIILVSFATRIEEVMKTICDIEKNYELYVPDMPVVDDEYFTSEFYNEHYNEIVHAYNTLSDEFSKDLFASIINYKLSAEVKFLNCFTSSVEEMYGLLDCDNIKCAVDAGAYNGDTVKEMTSYFKNVHNIYAFEPDPKNCKKLAKLSEQVKCTLKIFECALWKYDDEATFSSSTNRNSSLLNASYQHNDVKVKLVSLDNVITKKADYIKYDVEGVETQALEGSINTILRDRPSLLISVYHKSEDIFSILNSLSGVLKDYSFYLRRKACYPAWELNLYAIPNEHGIKNKS